MKSKRLFYIFLILTILLVSCNDSQDMIAQSGNETEEQSFTVVVESVGELYEEGNLSLFSTRHPISSVTPTQTFDRLALLIVEYKNPAKVVCKKIIDNWSNPDNKASIPWSTDKGQGRYTTIHLTGDDRLEDGKSYMVYVVGYQSGSYGNYEPFKNIEVGDYFHQTEIATVPENQSAEEIFAGAEVLFVQNGKILSKKDVSAELQPAWVAVRRQVAGSFGYFTHIPIEIDGKKIAKLRLVSTKQNQTVILGGFRGIDDSLNFHKDNVINGMNLRTDYNCVLAGSAIKNAFSVFEINLCKWFPGNTNDTFLPLDENGDGYLDGNDHNWQIDEQSYPDGTISLSRGSVFGDCFLIALAMTPDDIKSGLPTFQMQILDREDNIIKYWNVELRDYETLGENRTLVSLPDGPEGRTQITVLDNVDSENCFSIVRNRLYTMGEKSQSQSYGEDEPIDLSAVKVLVLDVRHEWNIQNSIIFN